MGESALYKKERERKSATKKKVKKGGAREAAPDGPNAEGIEEEKLTIGKKKEEKATHKGAKKVLRRAVKGEVKRQSNAIAQSLVQGVISGDARTASMMLSLMEKRKESEDETKYGPSVAELLEVEPELDESNDENSEAGSSGREPAAHRTAPTD